MKYTESKEADNKIQKDVEIIKKIIIKYEKPETIVMFGGFGHGGGSFIKKEEEILPLNDYDIYLITKKPISGEKLEKIGEECSRALHRGGLEIVEYYNQKYDENKFFHVDLHNITLKKLKKPLPLQRIYDLKTSIVILGNKNILRKIPEVKISKSDALRMLFNKLDHFAIAESNSNLLKSIYAVKGFTDSCSSLLIYYGEYTSKYQDRIKKLETLSKIKQIPKEYIDLVKIATNAKLKEGYFIKDVDEFFLKSKKWVGWILKIMIKEHLNIKSNNWKIICQKMYSKLPYIYFNDYLKSKYLFLGQYYLNLRFFLSGLRKREFLIKSLFRWRDAGLIIAMALILYSFGEKKEAEKYLRKLTDKTFPLKQRILKIYSIYYLQKLV
ncbi:MAG: hypothetical protein KKF48_04505 [Nanoarchaeota archaeon]|nr:hypothetical protein [Nanoarchaeota archaeon]MBU1028277.1 hypothetical protein [Nanoarchaeota archaeon]